MRPLIVGSSAAPPLGVRKAAQRLTTRRTTMTSKNGKQMKKIVGAVERNGKTWWTSLGVAFVNEKDGSINLRFDYLPTASTTTIQVRDFDEKDEDKAQAA
jgi:hypothetical protein